MNSLYASLADFWPLHEATGDADGMCGNNLTDTGGVTQNPGIIDYARQFTNASSQRLSIATNGNTEMGDIDFSVACWVYLDNKTTQQGIVMKDDGATGRDYGILYNLAADRLRFQVFRPTDTIKSADADALGSPSASTWYFVVGMHDAANDLVEIEINASGTINSTATGGALQGANAADFVIGGFQGSAYLDGRVCEVGIWKRLLTAQERTWLYNAGRGRSWPFDGRPNMARMGRNPLTAGPRRSRSSGVVSI